MRILEWSVDTCAERRCFQHAQFPTAGYGRLEGISSSVEDPQTVGGMRRKVGRVHERKPQLAVKRTDRCLGKFGADGQPDAFVW